MEKEDEEKLFEEIKADIDSGLRKVSEKYSLKLISFCIRSNIYKEDAEEIVSNVLLKFYYFFPKFKFTEKNSISRLLFKITINQINDFFRREERFKKENEVLKYDETDKQKDEIIEKGTSLVFEELKKTFFNPTDDSKEKVFELFNEFSQDEIADIYSYFNCTPYKLIAEETGSSIESVKKRITRLIQKLSNKIIEKFNLKNEKIYERIKREHKKDLSGRFTGK